MSVLTRSSVCLLHLLLVLSLAGCGARISTPYATPEAALPETWAEQSTAAIATQGRWWQQFADPELDRLVAEALERNLDLASAGLSVRKAQLRADMAASDQLPSVTVQGSTGISRELGSENSGETNRFAASGVVSYELDLWGRLGSITDAARWEAQATAEDRASAALSLIGTTASTYWQIGYLNHRLSLSQASIAYARRTLALVRLQKEAGASSTLEVLEAQRSLASQEANHAGLQQQRVEALNTLALLFDGAPETLRFKEPENLTQAQLPAINPGLPAHLLARRPDLRAVEGRLRASLATTDAARAAFYPSISLTGSLGDSSADLSRLLSNPVAALSADFALPFVQWRDVQRNINIAQADYDQTVLAFRKTLYTAMAEVENSLSARRNYRIQEEKLVLTLDAAKQTEQLYQVRYRAGGSPLKSWLDAQENRRQAEIALAANRLNQLLNYITLCKALGGDQTDRLGTDDANPER